VEHAFRLGNMIAERLRDQAMAVDITYVGLAGATN
jgi:hypothetical protein